MLGKAVVWVALIAVFAGSACQDSKKGKDETAKKERETPKGNTTTLGGVTNPEAEAVRKAFHAYKKAILASDGKGAAALLDKETRDYYGKILELAQGAFPKDLKKESPVRKLLVLQTRLHIPGDELKRMTAEGLLVYGIEKGWIGENARRVDIGDITVAGDRASGPGRIRGRTAPFSWKLRKEGGAWKLNLTTLFPIADAAIERAARRKGQTVDAFILDAINSRAPEGKKATKAIWTPPPEIVGRPAK
jgi:hypothetical protein